MKVLSHKLPELLEDGENKLPLLTHHLLAELKAEHDQLIDRISRIEAQLKAWHHSNALSRRLEGILGKRAVSM